MTVSVPEQGDSPAAALWETVPVFLDRSMRKETALGIGISTTLRKFLPVCGAWKNLTERRNKPVDK